MNWQEALRTWIDGGLKTCHPDDEFSETFRAGALWALNESGGKRFKCNVCERLFHNSKQERHYADGALCRGKRVDILGEQP